MTLFKWSPDQYVLLMKDFDELMYLPVLGKENK